MPISTAMYQQVIPRSVDHLIPAVDDRSEEEIEEDPKEHLEEDPIDKMEEQERELTYAMEKDIEEDEYGPIGLMTRRTEITRGSSWMGLRVPPEALL